MNKTRIIELNDEYHYIIDRYQFCFNRKIDSIAFLLSKHASDENGDFCHSEKIQRMVEEACDLFMERGDTMTGVAAILCGDDVVLDDHVIEIDRESEYMYIKENVI